MIYPKSARTYSDVRLMSLEKRQSIGCEKGGAINISGGGTLIFPPSAIVDAGGATYNGEVEVSAKIDFTVRPIFKCPYARGIGCRCKRW